MPPISPSQDITVDLTVINNDVTINGITSTSNQLVASSFLTGPTGPNKVTSSTATNLTGLLKGNGSTVQQATADTDYQRPITLTTTGASGPATLASGTLNIPDYAATAIVPATFTTNGTVKQTVYNVRDYGAKGDGTTDDHTAINNAITAANSAGGGKVYLPYGNYYITSGLSLKSNVSLEGDGQGVTKITGSTSDFTLISTPTSGTTFNVYVSIAVRRLTIVSSKGHGLIINNTTSVVLDDVEVYFTVTTPIRESAVLQYCEYATFRNCYLHDLTGNGVQINACNYFYVIGNKVVGGANADDLIDIDLDFLQTVPSVQSNYGVVSGNTITSGSKGNGIRVAGSNHIVVSGNTVDNVNTVGGAGIYVNGYNTAGSVYNTSNISVIGNDVSNCVSVGIVGVDTSHGVVSNLVISNNNVDNCGQTGGADERGGIVLNSSSMTVTGNHINNTSNTTNNAAGILVYKKDGHKISNNTVTNSVYGIATWNGDTLQSYTSTEISNNYLSGNTTNLTTSGCTSTCDIRFNTGQTDFFVDAVDHHVGIGTVTPSRTLDIEVANPIFRFNDTSAGSIPFEIQNANAHLSFYKGTLGSSAGEIVRLTASAAVFSSFGVQNAIAGTFTGTNLFSFPVTGVGYFNNGSNFGVGKTSATAQLDIAGSTTSSASLGIRSGTAPTTPNSGDIWFDGTHLQFRNGSTTDQLDNQGGGSVTTLSVVTANGVSGSVANPTTTPAVTLTLGAITPTTVNGLTIASSTGTLTVSGSKALTVSNSLTLAGTDSTTMTFPTTSATIARTDAANTFTGHQTIEGVTSTGATGTGNLVFATTPTLTTPIIGAATGTSITLTGSSANILTAGLNGATNPAVNVDASTASSATGLNIKSAAAGAGLALSVLSSGAAENLTINAKGTGTVSIASISTGLVSFGNGSAQITNSGSFIAGNNIAITAGGSAVGFKLSSTAGFGIFVGSGVPTITASQGSLYLRSDGSSISTRLYVNTNGSTGWTNVTTAT